MVSRRIEAFKKLLRLLIIKLRQYGLIYVLIGIVISLIVVTIVLTICSIEAAFVSLQIITGLFSGLIALIIPFELNRINNQKEKKDRKQILKRIIQIFNDFVESTERSDDNQTSIFSGIDYIKLNEKFLHYINCSLRANRTEGSARFNTPIPCKEIYDIIINDTLTIRIVIDAILNSKEFYKIDKIEFYDNNENKIIENRDKAIKILRGIRFNRLLYKI